MSLTRRQILSAAGVGSLAGAWPASFARAAEDASNDRAEKGVKLKISLNTSTIRGQKLPLEKQFDVAAEAGYDGIEPWINDIETFVKGGGSLEDLAKKAKDKNLQVVSAIGFAQWIVDDDAKRKAGLEQARRDMDWVRRLGGRYIAAPPAGETNNPNLNLAAAAERYAALCKLGAEIGVTPMVEVWGFSKCLSKLGESVSVAFESGAPNARLLADVYHLHKGGSPLAALNFLSPHFMPVLHVNDYPATPGRAEIADKDRVYPGDGVAPWSSIWGILNGLVDSGCFFSLELFNPDYWKQDALAVAKTGLTKTRDMLGKALTSTPVVG